MKPSLAATLLLGIIAPILTAQSPTPDSTSGQREAMQKLTFLAGRWSGPVTISMGPGEPRHYTQTENVQFKLGGLILLVEGQTTAPDGKVLFSAFATVAYDGASHTYRIRAYNAGHYVDSEFTVTPGGFSWGFPAGPVQIDNTMRLTGKGEWNETTETTFPNRPSTHSVEMLLTRQP